MTPSQLAKSGTEHAHQAALFCWAQVAEKYGFEAANEYAYDGYPLEYLQKMYQVTPVPELRWLHAIPNGGSRGDDAKSRAIRGGQLKAEGVKVGVSDICLPVKMTYDVYSGNILKFHSGLYIEMKRPGKLKDTSQEQKDFGAFVQSQGFAFIVCDNWQMAAEAMQRYMHGQWIN